MSENTMEIRIQVTPSLIADGDDKDNERIMGEMALEAAKKLLEQAVAT